MIFLVIAAVIIAAATAYTIWAMGQERRIETTAHLDARANEVWAVLADFPAYGEWNPFITEISGLLAEEERLEVAFKQVSEQHPDGRTTRFRPRILRVSPARQIRWLGKLGPGGLFDGEHYFVLEPQSDGTTVLIHGERFTGVLVPLMSSVLDDTERNFTAMNQALAARLKTVEA
ncbi:SRPBCC domain-containing protein [Glycomyces sp. TRM65418]|uniref:SRPBCC domain-containing protein n=1 Tax=Glycomyces sp. TRM65418 TaxID=2867006 RepID=UPI001CE62FAB|nr:SRPBCC domain-containing protein [Glycomyces sp. TRM65418]MCC3764032.1 SRPBCC domain-containing protein [Glycomyces sp. TRM65418]QZD53723.1 SRPBCC domain-containing protein [Glycomyces sp. TRM65418]